MQVRLLGPVDVAIDGAAPALPGLRRKAVLAVLGLHRGAVVGVDRIVGLAWEDDDAAVQPNTVQRHVSDLRTVLRDRSSIEARPPGYLLHTGTDLAAVEDLVRAGRAAERAEVAVEHFRRALGLWRGPALADLRELPWLRAQGERLDQLRLDIQLDLVDARLRLADPGDREALLRELHERAAARPFDERVHGQLMRALSVNGQQRQAEEVYRRLEEALDREFGLRPGAALRAQREALRAQREALRAQREALRPDRPAQLPATVRGFAGRVAELERLDALADAGGGVVVIEGTAGVGKTALTLFWAHRAAHRFPDGQLYVNLRGFDPGSAALRPADALAVLLDGLGLPAPTGPAERAALFTTTIQRRRLLVVLDNARDGAQVRALLPKTGTSLVLVTSRAHIDTPATIGLDVMTPDEARELLRHRLGDARPAAEPAAVDEIVARCAHLPLAMGVVAAHAAARPHIALAQLAGELRDAARRWHVLDGGDAVSDVRAVLSWSYLALPAATARMFRLLGAHPGPVLGTAAAAGLAGVAPEVATELLAELCRASLLTEPEPGRFTHHDLLRGYALELAAAQDEPEATRRVLDHYVNTAVIAAAVINPSWPPVSPPEPAPGVTVDVKAEQRWLTEELPTLLAAVEAAAVRKLDVHAWQLAWALTDLLERQGRWDDWEAAHGTGLRAAERAGDAQAVAHLHRGLGRLRMWQWRYQEALAHFGEALERFQALGDRHGEARTEHNLCQLADREGRLPDAARHAQRSLDLCRELGDRADVAKELNALAWCHLEAGELDHARAACEEAAAIYREVDDPAQEGAAQHTLGGIHHRRGDLAAAAACYERAVALSGGVGDRYAEALALDGLGDTGTDPDEARRRWEQALTILTELGRPEADAVRAKLSSRAGG
ncbi:BTAD domain-containing putative transcriptional regulator [Dactylosporangium sp. CS-047395]|uniref:AfsR/SARP family transcriptional regulator n=1 Tax=Dactylosporangium sp. CS-047395 TaxID=3239936 RepID=UPI003D8ECCC7